MPVFNKMVYNGTEYILGGGGNIGEPLNLTVTTSGLDATITWEDNEIGTIPPTTFQKSELVRKVGSAPTSPSDGTLVVTETVKDTYKVSGYVDSGLTDGATYYYRVFSYSDLGGISYCDAVSVTVSQGWDMSNWTEAQSVSISSYSWSGGCAFNPDGTKVYISGYDGNTVVRQFSLSTAYDLTTMSLDKSISIEAEDLFFKPDGTVLYTVGTNNYSPQIYEHELSTPRDIGSYTSTTYNLGPTFARSFWMSNDGTKVFIGSSSNGVKGYTLSTPYDLGTATQSSTTTAINATGLWIKPDGTMIFGDQGEGYDTIIYGKLSTPRDLSTLTNTQTAPIHGENEASGKWFNEDGTLALFVGGGFNTNYITKYTL